MEIIYCMQVAPVPLNIFNWCQAPSVQMFGVLLGNTW